jgi:tetratricopeptide (TPR) repeat protein
MTRYLPLVIIILAVLFFTTTGFQCGSAETTSAKLYMQQKNWPRAEESLLKEVTKNPNNEEAWLLLGQARLEMKNYPGMLEAYQKALSLSDVHKAEINRNRLAVWAMSYNEGVAYYNKGRDTASYFDKAIVSFNTAIMMEPDSSSTYFVAALAQYAKQDVDGAAKSLETALVKKPDYAEAARFLGQLYYMQAAKKLEAKDQAGADALYLKAVGPFETAYKCESSNAENITNLIEVYERTKQNDKALNLTRDAVAREPGNKVFRYAYGVFLLRQENYQEATVQFEEALKIDPEYADAVYNCGVSYLNWGVAMKEAADKKYEAERKANKGKDVKEDYSFKEKLKLALPYLEKSAKLRPDDALLWQQLARVYANLNMNDKSKAAFERYDQLTKVK